MSAEKARPAVASPLSPPHALLAGIDIPCACTQVRVHTRAHTHTHATLNSLLASDEQILFIIVLIAQRIGNGMTKS